MAYFDTYKAFVKFDDGTTQDWNGLRKTQAIWRYNALRRAWPDKASEVGWKREFQA